jgi:hypothetical protein
LPDLPTRPAPRRSSWPPAAPAIAKAKPSRGQTDTREGDEDRDVGIEAEGCHLEAQAEGRATGRQPTPRSSPRRDPVASITDDTKVATRFRSP